MAECVFASATPDAGLVLVIGLRMRLLLLLLLLLVLFLFLPSACTKKAWPLVSEAPRH
jgi:hypothetical protein